MPQGPNRIVQVHSPGGTGASSVRVESVGLRNMIRAYASRPSFFRLIDTHDFSGGRRVRPGYRPPCSPIFAIAVSSFIWIQKTGSSSGARTRD